MGQLQPFICPFTLKCINRKGGGQDCGEMGSRGCVDGRRVKSKGMPKYQREEVSQSKIWSPSHPAMFSPSMLWSSILNTKDVSSPFDQYIQFHWSALFCLCSQAGGSNLQRLWFIPPLHLLLMLLFVPCLPHILEVIAFRQIIYLCEFFNKAYLWRLYRQSGSCSWLVIMEVMLHCWLVKEVCSVTH